MRLPPRWLRGALVTASTLVLQACVGPKAGDVVFTCRVTSDCRAGWECRAGSCQRPDGSVPEPVDAGTIDAGSGLDALAKLDGVLFLFDHRRNLTLDASGRVETWGSLASTVGVGAIGQQVADRRPLHDADGLGRNSGEPGAYLELIDASSVALQRALTNQQPHVLLLIGRQIDNNSSSNGAVIAVSLRDNLVTHSSVYSPGFQRGGVVRRFDGSPEYGPSRMFNDGQLTLFEFRAYGPGSGNVRVRSTINSIDLTDTIGAADGTFDVSMVQMTNLSADTLPQQRVRLLAAFALPGKTPQQVDAFCTMLENTLRQDPDYAAIVPPPPP